jgi:hypothetical protein
MHRAGQSFASSEKHGAVTTMAQPFGAAPVQGPKFKELVITQRQREPEYLLAVEAFDLWPINQPRIEQWRGVTGGYAEDVA